MKKGKKNSITRRKMKREEWVGRVSQWSGRERETRWVCRGKSAGVPLAEGREYRVAVCAIYNW